jgi:hypothetical protein
MIDANLRRQINGMNMDELKELNDIAVRAMKRLIAAAADTFRPGDLVSFQGRSGETLSGTVTKVNQKTVSVRVGNTNWKVSGTLLRLQVAAVFPKTAATG